MSDFTPKTRLEKILCGVVTTAKTRLEKAVKYAVDHAGGGGGGNDPFEVDTVVSQDEESGKTVLNTAAVASELFDALIGSRAVIMNISAPSPEGNVTIRKIVQIFAMHIAGSREEEESYYFSFADEADDNVCWFKAQEIGGTDTVVFRQM